METSDEPPPNPNLYFSKGEFTLPNGDKYSGQYCAHIFGLIWREGHGVYTAKDGEKYEGEWKDDKLIDDQEVKITFASGEQYHGVTAKDKYCGPGTYVLKDKMDISCEFFDNNPTGTVYLIDIHKRIWQGTAGENNVILYPENQFYYSLSETTGMGKLKKKYKLRADQEEALLKAQQQLQLQPELTDKEKQQLIFAKTTKMPPCFDFNECKWVQRYLRYKEMKAKLMEKLKDPEGEGFTEDEEKWCKKYEAFRERVKQRDAVLSQPSLTDTSLLQTYHSEEYKNKWPALKTFYPPAATESSFGEEDGDEH